MASAVSADRSTTSSQVLDPPLYCLFNPECAPVLFKSQRTGNELKTSCQIPDCANVQQLMVFLQGSWPTELKGKKISVEIALFGKQALQLCSLSEESKFCHINTASYKNFPKSGKATMVASLLYDNNNKTETSVKKTQAPAQQIVENVRKTKTKAHQKVVTVPNSRKTRKRLTTLEEKTTEVAKHDLNKQAEEKSRDYQTEKVTKNVGDNPTKKKLFTKEALQDENVPPKNAHSKEVSIQQLNENTPEMTFTVRSPFSHRQRKRDREEETTPKPKSRRQKMSMKTLTTDSCVLSSTPPAVAKSDTKETCAKLDEKIIRCVDLSARTPKPSQRWGHTMTFINNKQVVLIGGQGEKQLNRDSIWLLDPEMRTWKCPEITTESNKPEYRVGHSATYDPTMRCIYVFGGSKNTKWFHDVHMFDLDENKWQLVKAEGKAPTRAYHSATLWRHELWVFGGIFPRPDPQPDGCDNEIHIFSPVMQNWYTPIVTGEKPRARSGHSATLINDLMVVFGGWDFPYCYNDVCILDLTTVDWSTPSVFGEPPKPRSWHASCSLTHNRIFIHGGYDGDLALHDSHIFDLDTKTWTQLDMSKAPSARAGHVAVFLPSDYEDQEEDEVVVFGGGDNDGCYFSDMLSFYVPQQIKALSM